MSLRALPLLILLAGCTDGAVGDSDVRPDPDDTDAEDLPFADLQGVFLEADLTVLRPEDRVTLRVGVAFTDFGREPRTDIVLESSNPAVLALNAREAVAIAPGEASVTATATTETGDEASYTLDFRVVPGPALVEPALFTPARQLMARPGEAIEVPLRARDDAGHPVTPTVLDPTTTDEAIVAVEGEAIVAAGEGTAWVTVGWREAETRPVPVVVTDDSRALTLRREAPDHDLIVDATLALDWTTAWVPHEGGPGEPTAVDRVTLLDHDTGEVIAEAERTFGEATVTVDTSAWDEGTHWVRAEVEVDGTIAHEAPLRVTVDHPDPVWLDDRLLGDFADETRQRNIRLRPDMLDLTLGPDGAPWLSTVYGSEVRAGTFRDGAWVNPFGEPFTRGRHDDATVRWNAGSWQPRADLRDRQALFVDGEGRPVLAYVIDDDAHGRSPDYLRSIMAARFQDDGRSPRYDGGYVLLSPERRHEIYEDADVRIPFPAGPLSDRTLDAFSPRFVEDEGLPGPMLGYLTRTALGTDAHLEVRQWGGDAWSSAVWREPVEAPAYDHVLADIGSIEGDGSVATIHGTTLGVPETAFIDYFTGERTVLRGHVFPIRAHRLAVVTGHGDVGIGRLDEDLSRPDVILDRDPFARADAPCVAAGEDAIFVAWREGPTDRQRIHAGWFDLDTRRFTALEPVIARDPDARTGRLRCALDPDGRAVLAWSEAGWFGRHDFEDHRVFVTRFAPPSD